MWELIQPRMTEEKKSKRSQDLKMMTDFIRKIPLRAIYHFHEVSVTAAPTEGYGSFSSFICFDVLWKGVTQGAFGTAIISTEDFNEK